MSLWTSFVHDNKMWVTGGAVFDGTASALDAIGDVWSSEDGITWVEETNTAEFLPRFRHTISPLNDELILIGGRFKNLSQGAFKNDIWRSSNGVNWQKFYNYKLPLNE